MTGPLLFQQKTSDYKMRNAMPITPTRATTL